MSANLIIDGLSVSIGSREILSDVSLAPIAPGKLVAIIGPNGAGKSTFLRAIGGLMPGSGSIMLGQRNLAELSRRDHARMIGFVPQHAANPSTISVVDSITTMLRASGIVPHEASALELAYHALERLNLLPLSLRPLHSLSGGEAQMAALAQAVAHRPPLLLLDEPTSALDPARVLILLTALREYQKTGGIVLAVLHDLNQALEWATDLIVIKHGALVAQGPARKVMTPELLRYVYGVSSLFVETDSGMIVRTTGLAK